MRKIPRKLENPIDDVLIELSDKICDPLKKLNLTPNMITTISLIFGIIAAIFLWKKLFIPFVFFYILSYFFDCVDGHYARKYSMVTKFGDYYDHVKDIVIALLLVVIVYLKCGKKDHLTFAILGIFIIFTFLGYMHLGCQEKYYGKAESDTLGMGIALCPGSCIKNLETTRWFGMGTWIIVTIFCIYVLLYRK